MSDHATEALDAAVGGAAGAAAGLMAGPVGIVVGAAAGAAVGALLGAQVTKDQHARDRVDHALDEIDAEEEFFGGPRVLGAEPPPNFGKVQRETK